MAKLPDNILDRIYNTLPRQLRAADDEFGTQRELDRSKHILSQPRPGVEDLMHRRVPKGKPVQDWKADESTDFAMIHDQMSETEGEVSRRTRAPTDRGDIFEHWVDPSVGSDPHEIGWGYPERGLPALCPQCNSRSLSLGENWDGENETIVVECRNFDDCGFVMEEVEFFSKYPDYYQEDPWKSDDFRYIDEETDRELGIDKKSQWSLHDLTSPGRPTIMQNDVNRGNRNDNRFEDIDLTMAADVEAPYSDSAAAIDNPMFEQDKQFDIVKGAGDDQMQPMFNVGDTVKLVAYADLEGQPIYVIESHRFNPMSRMNQYVIKMIIPEQQVGEMWKSEDDPVFRAYPNAHEDFHSMQRKVVPESAIRLVNTKQASSWALDHTDMEKEAVAYKTAKIGFGKNLDPIITAQIADTDDLQVLGLQDHDGLDKFAGMVFPYAKPRNVKFHMGKVSFPIDIIFVNGEGRVGSIAENILPGTTGHWGHSHVVSVVEVPGGFCKEHDIGVGTELFEIQDGYGKEASSSISKVAEAPLCFTFRGTTFKVDREMVSGKFFVHWNASDPHWREGKYFSDLVSKCPSIECVEDVLGSLPGVALSTGSMSPRMAKASDVILRKVAEEPKRKATPALRNMQTGQVVVDPRGHGPATVDVLSPEEYKAWEAQPASADMNIPGWEDGGVDENGNWLTREEYELIVYGPRDIPKAGQEEFPDYPRKDVNPQMLPPVNIDPSVRFKDRAPIDIQVDHQESPRFEMNTGNDPISFHDVYDGDSEAPAPVRPS
jgi:uncharacterized protein